MAIPFPLWGLRMHTSFTVSSGLAERCSSAFSLSAATLRYTTVLGERSGISWNGDSRMLALAPANEAGGRSASITTQFH